MKTYKTVNKEEQQLTDVTCDVCKREFNAETDFLEVQEFFYVDFVGGYGSVFGDGHRVQCDMCQNCLKSILNHYQKNTIR